VQRFLRFLILHAVAAVLLLIAPHSVVAAPPTATNRAVVMRVQPVYPELAKRMGVNGIVIVRAVVQPNGTVSETHIESGHALLQAAAADAVRHWRFAANPNATECLVSVGFELAH
jgi:TonB family protein